MLSWHAFLTRMKSHLNSQTELVWASEDFLREQKVYSFSDLPLWAPLSEDLGFMQISNQKMLDTGYRNRSLEDTFQDVLAWARQQKLQSIPFGTSQVEIGLSKERQKQLLESLVTRN